METYLTVRPLGTILLSFLRFVGAVWLFAAPLSLRDGARKRIPLALFGLFALYVCLLLLFVPSADWQDPMRHAFGELATFSILLGGLVLATTYVFDTNILTAVFCSSAGYTVENFASGLTELVLDLFGSPANKLSVYASPLHHIAMIATTVGVYAVVFFLVTKPMLRQGLCRIEDRTMLAMMVVVIAVIISFDLLIKGLVADGLDVRAMVLLRIFHGLACVFTLGAGFQLLVVRRIEAERDAAWQVLAERERQYEASRENVDAINARVHDIRHAIGRLANDAQVNSDVLASMVREIDVCGKSLRTGNAALDTVLAEKGLTCSREGIALTCVADGSLLSVIAPGDTYALFSTLLDEAIERTLSGSEGRSISLVIREAMGNVAIHLECTEQATISRPHAQLAPLNALCERYKATLATIEQDGLWHANVLLPLEG